MAQDGPKLRKLIELPPQRQEPIPGLFDPPQELKSFFDPLGTPADASVLAKIAAFLGVLGPKIPKLGRLGKVARRTPDLPPNVQKLDLPEFTAVGEEPLRIRPHFKDPLDEAYKKVLKQGGRVNSPSAPKKAPDGK